MRESDARIESRTLNRVSWIALTAVLALACASGGGMQIGTFRVGYQASIADPRISEKQIALDDDGITITIDKYAASPEALAAAEIILPDMVDAAVSAAVACLKVDQLGAIFSACDTQKAVQPPELPEVTP